MAFMSLEILFLEKKRKVLLNFDLFVFVYLLPIRINKRSRNLSVFEKNAIKKILRAKIWLYDFESVFWKVLIEFPFVVFLLFFM